MISTTFPHHQLASFKTLFYIYMEILHILTFVQISCNLWMVQAVAAFFTLPLSIDEITRRPASGIRVPAVENNLIFLSDL